MATAKPENPACEHWEAASGSYFGHCSHASCPNYLNSCLRHDQSSGLPDDWSCRILAAG